MWSELFDADFPGAITASVSPHGQLTRTVTIQWWKEFYKESEDFIDASRVALKAVIQTIDAHDLDRNDKLTVDNVEYLIVAVNHDGHGMTTLYLEME